MAGGPGAGGWEDLGFGAWQWMRSRPIWRGCTEDTQIQVGPDGAPVLGLTTTWYEAFRWRMGRRSRDQLAALDWSGDPAPVLDHLVIFCPARADVIE